VSIIRFDHIAIVVRDLDQAILQYSRILDFDRSNCIEIRNYVDIGPDDVLDTILIPIGESWLEIIAPVKEGGNMHKALVRRGEGVHHIGLTSDDVREDWRRQAKQRDEVGIVEPKPNVDQFDVSFWYLHPKAMNGVLIEMDSAWAKTSLSDMTPIEPTPDWDVVIAESGV
jgi:methylmalonyl-CoA/ethylmalonyl-CoA epimerase